MKRKVIQLAGKTLVVSLPNKWAKKYGVKKGDDIHVEEEEHKLVVKIDEAGIGGINKRVLDVKDLYIMLNRTGGALYKAGYDEVEIIYHSPEQYAILRDLLNYTCMGFEIMKHDKRTITIKNLSDLHSQEFDNIMRRLFLTLLSSVDDALEFMKRGDLKGMEEIVLRDANVNKFCDMCRRILNVRGHGVLKKTTTYYHISEELGRIGDAYADLMGFMVKNDVKKADEDIINLMVDLNKYLRDFYELFYQFDLKGLENFGEKSRKIRDVIEKRLDSTAKASSNRTMIMINNYFFRIYLLIFNMNGALITANI
ncbi:phosphate uptake regulator PhoU [Candidatus Woesearchaeota archaeon]|nr:phosphate uptake regulator PhoU [Candidatus Woesearchaeota archaeon]